MALTPTQTPPRQHADAPQFSPDRLKAFIEARLRNREAPERIAAGVYAYFGVALDPDQVVPYWRGEFVLPTQTEHRQDKESVQLPADRPPEPEFTRRTEIEAAAPTVFSIAPDDAPATQTGRRQDAESPQDADALQIPADPVDDPRVTREARDAALEALGALARARLGITPDPAKAADGAPAEDAATQTGRRQNQKTKSVLTDEMKAFIVRGLARYETPTRVAASVQLEFGIAIDRRQVYAYDPAGSRPPAQRWIDLHAATRAKFLSAVAEIGVAQKVVRLRMLDRFANRLEEANYPERAAAFLAQAAKECGGFYERYARPHRAAAPASR
ncbi:DUF2280 domain-containing protein [Dongia sp. agr-C8]